MGNKKIQFAVLLFGLILVAGCAQTSTTSSNVPAPGNEDVDEMVVAGESEGELKVFDIEAFQFGFNPEVIEVNEGDTVELHIQSLDVTHGFALPEFGINERLEPNRDVHVTFVADKKGTFSFYCSVPCGSGHGAMSGQLIVN